MDATAVLPPAAAAFAQTPHDRSPHRLLVAPPPIHSLVSHSHTALSQGALKMFDDDHHSPQPLHDTDSLFDNGSTATSTVTLDARALRALSAASSITGGRAPGSAASSTVSFELKRESSEERERGRCDSSLTGGDARLSICSTSGTVYESVVVVGHIYGSDNVVYYLLEVKSWEMPLEGYVIRRRYNDFKELHRELALCMPLTGGVRRGSSPPQPSVSVSGTTSARRASTSKSSTPFGMYSSSLLCTGLSSSRPETSPLWSPTRPAPPSHRRGSITGFRLPGVEESHEPHTTVDPHAEYDTRFSAPVGGVTPVSGAGHHQVGRPQWSTNHGFADLPFHNVSFNRDSRPLLPPMPPGGVSSFFSSREMLIKYRIEKFNRILAAVLSDTSASVAQLLMNFIQDKPSAPQTYVSLNQYAPVEMPWSVERYARRRATMSGKRDKALQTALATAG